MRSYIKIYGPPMMEAIKALERIAFDMPEICIMDTVISREIPPSLAEDIGGTPIRDRTQADWAMNYFNSSSTLLSIERCKNIISRSGSSLGEFDFFFEWLKTPSQEQFYDFIIKLDEALAPLGCYYTLTTKK